MLTAAIITASDKGSRGERIDESGKKIQSILIEKGYEIKHYEILPDEQEQLKEALVYVCDKLKVNLVLTTGGTGFSERDVTPEATKAVIEKEARGISEAIRFYGLQKTSRAMLSRGVSGIRGKTLIINLPGSVKGVSESLESILDTVHHGLEVLGGHTQECGRK